MCFRVDKVWAKRFVLIPILVSQRNYKATEMFHISGDKSLKLLFSQSTTNQSVCYCHVLNALSSSVALLQQWANCLASLYVKQSKTTRLFSHCRSFNYIISRWPLSMNSQSDKLKSKSWTTLQQGSTRGKAMGKPLAKICTREASREYRGAKILK